MTQNAMQRCYWSVLYRGTYG